MASDPHGLEIPRRLDDPPRLFWWDLDVSLIVLCATLAGMVSGFLATGIALGLAAATAYARAKSGQHPGFALHLAYWNLPAAVTGLKRTPPSWQRELAG